MLFEKLLSYVAKRRIRRNLHLPAIVDVDLFPWFIHELDECLADRFNNQRTLMIPDLGSANTIAVFSDYGGEHPASTHRTYAFLFCDYDSIRVFGSRMRRIRRRHGLLQPYKEIEYKDLDYGPLKRALPEVLKAANGIDGLLFTLLVDKRIVSLFGPDDKGTIKHIGKVLAETKLDHWRPSVYEKNIRILHTLAYMLKLLSSKKQNLFWMTDEDEIGANKKQVDSMGPLLKGFLDHYLGERFFNKQGYAVCTNTWKHSDFSSVLGLADLVAGSLSDYFQNTGSLGAPSVSSSEADEILMWAAGQSISLKKLSFMISKTDSDTFTSGILDMHLKKPLPNVRMIGIRL